ncbi:queen brain-selective protein-1 [Xylocopa sonorina]|uniref:queen brain-selective protein-1 n=1 Tax=Xylocopa sonorina TaxID=1818115 RepID=UPI00403AD460
MFAQFIRVVIVLVILFRFDECSGFPWTRQKQDVCKGCGDMCDRCEYGIVKSIACDVLQCAKGPDEKCGGPDQVFGICGEGMYCNCNRCMGCSQLKLNCATTENPCLPYKSVGYNSNSHRFGRSTAV